MTEFQGGVTDGPSLEEIQAWWEKVQDAEFVREPLYVTPEEFADLKWRFSPPPRPVEDRLPFALDPYFMGTPVIVDAEKAREQRERVL